MSVRDQARQKQADVPPPRLSVSLYAKSRWHHTSKLSTAAKAGGFPLAVFEPERMCFSSAGELGERPGAVRSAGNRPLPHPPPQAGEGK